MPSAAPPLSEHDAMSSPATSRTWDQTAAAQPLRKLRPRDPLRAWFVAGLVLATAVVLSPNDADPDLWGHVRYGQDVLRNGALPAAATHTFTARGYPWVNHENLAELALALVAQFAGGVGLMIFKAVLGLFVVGLMLRAARRQGVGLFAATVVVLLAAMNLAAGWSVRPQLFSYAFFALLVVLLDRCFQSGEGVRGQGSGVRGWTFLIGRLTVPSVGSRPLANPGRTAWLWAVPPLIALWANTHGGFLAGCFVLALYLGCRSVEAIARIGRGAWRPVARYALVLLACALATLYNPYGLEYLRWLHRSLAEPRPEISEWDGLTPADPAFLPFVLLVGLSGVAFLAGRRRLDWAHVAILAVTAWQSCVAVRHIPFFAILVGLWLPPHVQGLLDRLRAGRQTETAAMAPRCLWALSRGIWLTLVLMAGLLGWRLREIRVEKGTYPVAAFRYMADLGLRGKLLVFFDWAQYALAAFSPPSTLSFDGRFDTCYPREVIDAHFDFILGDIPARRWRGPHSPPVDASRALDLGQPDLVLISRRSRHAPKVMREQADWVLLYQDGLAELWGRRTKYDDPTSPAYVARQRRRVGDQPQSGHVRWPALPS